MTYSDYTAKGPAMGGPADLSAGDPAGLRKEWSRYVAGFARWTAFITLTFSEQDRTHDVTRSECEFLWRRLIQVCNSNLYGNHYPRLVGHSYFAYAVSFEYQSRGVLHMHALTDGVTHWELINRVWRHMAGIVKIKPVMEREKVASYLCKYITKGGDVLLYKPMGPARQPAYKPMWYLEATEALKARSTE